MSSKSIKKIVPAERLKLFGGLYPYSFMFAMIIFAAMGAFNPCVAQLAEKEDNKSWKFVSIPDFLNVDIKCPEPRWDDALDYVLNCIKAENPDFVLVAGDMVMGRWWRGEKQIEYMADIYYTAWIQRMKKHQLKFYVAVGDHEIGDNPWRPDGKKQHRWMGTWDCAKLSDVACFEAVFVKHFKMPQNGPEHMKGLTYSFVHKNTLFISVDVFEKETLGTGSGVASVSGGQLGWLDSTISDNNKVNHVIVMAHTPILGPVRKKNSSGLMLKNGRNSKFWQLMKKHNADLFLCGEVHAITCIEADDIEQISHGSLFGYNRSVNYLVVTVSPKQMFLELKEIDTVLQGAYLAQSAGNEPREYVRILPEQKKAGFRTVGTMVIDKESGQKKLTAKTGLFIEQNNPKKNSKMQFK